MNSWPNYGILSIVMGTCGKHHPHFRHPQFRLLCHLLAGFWSLTTLLGAVQPAVCAFNSAAALADTSVSWTALCRCPMCGHLHRVGMKCCCCPADRAAKTGQMTLCAACPVGKDHTVAALVWSEPAFLGSAYAVTLPNQRSERLAPPATALRLLRYAPFPRPPCLS